MKRFRNSVLLCLGTSAVAALGTWLLLTETRVEAQGPKQLTATVTAVLAVPGETGELKRFEDPEYGIVCYLLPSGFLLAQRNSTH